MENKLLGVMPFFGHILIMVVKHKLAPSLSCPCQKNIIQSIPKKVQSITKHWKFL